MGVGGMGDLGCREEVGTGEYGWDGEEKCFSFFFFFFFNFNLEDLGFFFKLKNYYFCHVAHIWQPRGTNVAATSTLNGSMDGKCNEGIILK